MLLDGSVADQPPDEWSAPARRSLVRGAGRAAQAEGSAAHAEACGLVPDRPHALPLPSDQGVHAPPTKSGGAQRSRELLPSGLRDGLRGQDVRLRPRGTGGKGAAVFLRLSGTPILLCTIAAPSGGGNSLALPSGPSRPSYAC